MHIGLSNFDISWECYFYIKISHQKFLAWRCYILHQNYTYLICWWNILDMQRFLDQLEERAIYDENMVEKWKYYCKTWHDANYKQFLP
jgi:hypothetical protein